MRKRLFILFIMLVGILPLTSCTLSNRNKFKLDVTDDFGYLFKPLDKYYEAGEEVQVHLECLSGVSAGINLNGEYIGESADTKHEDGHPVITFTMPNKDSVLYTTQNGYILKECKSEEAHKYQVLTLDVCPPKTSYVCELCGKKKNEQVNNGEAYSLSFTGAVEYLKNDILGKYASGSIVTIETKSVIDADIEIYANGVKVPAVNKDTSSDVWYFQFVMPSEDVVVDIRVAIYACIQDLDEYKWINNLDISDIIKVRYESCAIGIAPGNLISIEYSTDPADILNLYNSIVLAKYQEASSSDAQIDGGGYIKYTFITNDDSYTICISNGFVLSHQNHNTCDLIELKYYKFLAEKYYFKSASTKCNSFLVYNPSYKAYSVENDKLIGEYNDLDEFEFMPYDGIIPDGETFYYIETSFGRVYIHSDCIFYFKNGNTFTCFKLIGNKNFPFIK